MSTTESLTPAQKAEARRLRILAKKNARMAYASGDRSVLPKQAPSEEVSIPTPPSVTNPIERNDDKESTTISNPSTNHDVDIRPTIPFAMTGNPTVSSTTQSALLHAHRTRRLILALLAVMYVLCTNEKFFSETFLQVRFNVSVVELFGIIQFAIFCPLFISWLQGFFTQYKSISTDRSMINIVLNAVRSVSMLYKMISTAIADFSVFFLAFICAIYALNST